MTKESNMDLSGMTLAELDRLVNEEKERRRLEAAAQLEAFAAKQGYRLAELIGCAPFMRRDGKLKGGRTGRVMDPSRVAKAVEMLRQGLPYATIATELGYHHTRVAQIAKAHGLSRR